MKMKTKNMFIIYTCSDVDQPEMLSQNKIDDLNHITETMRCVRRNDNTSMKWFLMVYLFEIVLLCDDHALIVVSRFQLIFSSTKIKQNCSLRI